MYVLRWNPRFRLGAGGRFTSAIGCIIVLNISSEIKEHQISFFSNDLIIYEIPRKINKKSNTLTSDELTEE